MIKNKTIQGLCAFLMLLLFTQSITPKRYLHYLFANHKDIISYSSNEGKTTISKSGFQCDGNSLVATSPFLESPAEITTIIFSHYKLFDPHYNCSVTPTTHSFFELRGPPALV